MKKIFYSIAICGLLIGVACNDKKEANTPTIIEEEITFTKDGTLTITREEKDIANFDIEIADDDYKTQTGLMYRSGMDKEQAMLFIFNEEQPRSFYMKNTEFSLDIIFIDSHNKIVSIGEEATPYSLESIPSTKPAQYVLEINGGLANELDIQIGDSIQWERN